MTIQTVSGAEIEIEPQLQSFMTRGVQKFVLPNRLTVITKEIHDRPVVSTIIWYRVGSRDEELGQTGKSHFLEHMLFKGTDRYKKGEIDLMTVRNGGSNNAFTWLDFTAYYFKLASDRWQLALEIESNRMRNTAFDQLEFEAEKQVVEEELRIGLDGPWEVLENEVWATAFRQHSYHWPTVGWLEDLESATAADMKAYYDKWYHPRNATLVIVGDFNTAEAIEEIKRLFGSIPAGDEVARHRLVEPEQKGQKRVLVKKATPVERLLIAYHAPAVGHPDSYAFHLADAILSTGKASRLYRRLIDRDQSVTLAKASFNDHIDPSLFYIQAELQPGFKLEQVEKAIYEEIERLKNEPVAEAELERARRQIEAELVMSNEETLNQAILLGTYETIAFDGRIAEESRGYKYLSTFLDRIRAVGADDLARIARKYFTEDNRTVGYLIDDGTGTGAGLDEISDSGALTAQPEIPNVAERAAFRTGPDHKAVSAPLAEDVEAIPAQGYDIDETRATCGGGSENARNNRPAGSGLKLDVDRVRLPNGLTLLLSENHTSPSVSINAFVQAGSRYESDEEAGLASLVAGLLDEGTTSRTSEQIAETIEAVGGRLGTFGDYDESGVRSAFLSKDISLGLDIVADLLMNPTFPEEKVRQHIQRRIAQIKSRLDVPRVQASDLFNEIVFKGTPQHRPAVGYEATVKKLSRESVLGFYNRFYVPNNAILAIVGDFDKAAIKRKVEEAFSYWPRANEFLAPAVPRPSIQSQAIDRFVSALKEQVNIFIGHVGIERQNPDYYALLVMDTVLGSTPGFTSRIPRILRDEQGLAYTTFSNITASAGVEPGRFIAYIGTSPENLERALAGLRFEIRRIVSEPVSADELEVAKDYLTGNFVFNFQTNAQIAEFLIEAEIFNLGFDYLERYPAIIRAVTVEDIARVTRQYLHPERLTTVVVGPVDGSGKVAKKNDRR